MKFTLGHNDTLTLRYDETEQEYEIMVTYEYTTARPAPNCHDHDSAAFADSGDEAEVEILAVQLITYTDYLDNNDQLQTTAIPTNITSLLGPEVIENLTLRLLDAASEQWPSREDE